jgi:hypothetical protein
VWDLGWYEFKLLDENRLIRRTKALGCWKLGALYRATSIKTFFWHLAVVFAPGWPARRVHSPLCV